MNGPFSDLLAKAKLTQTALARLSGVNKATVCRWARGRVSAERAIAIEEATAGAISRSDLRPDLWPPNDEAAA
jgi:DNA-binding transcriptional regulator YdaS (Cro superfamily)